MRRHLLLAPGTALVAALALLAGQVYAANLSTYIGAGSTLCEYSSGWQLSAVPNPFSDQIAFATRLGDSLRVTLPKNTSSITYIGFKDTAPALFSACLDCDGANRANSKQVFVKYNGTVLSDTAAAPFFSFRDMNPTTSHVLTVTNLLDSSFGTQARTSFAGLVIAIANGTTVGAPGIPGAPPPLPGQGNNSSSILPSVSPGPSSSSSSSQASASLSSTTISMASRPNNWVASSTTASGPTASRTNSLPPGTLPSVASSGQQTEPTAGSAVNSSHKGLSTGVVALIAVLASLGGPASVVLAGFLLWRKRNAGTRGMMPLGDDDRGSSMASIEPYLLTAPGVVANTSDRTGRPSSPNFFTAQPFGPQDGWTSRPPSVRIAAPVVEPNPFADDTGVEEVPRRQTSSPASPWLLRTPRDSWSSTR